MDYQRINEYLTSIFNNVLVIEEVTVHHASIEGMPFKVKDQFTDPSDMEEGKLRITLSGYQL